MVSWGEYALDHLVAPDLSKFDDAVIPDLDRWVAVQENWLAHYLLNSLDKGLAAPAYQRMYYFLRRTQTAVTEWQLARDATLRYLEGRSPLLYLRAISHWESVLTAAWQAHTILSRGKKSWFKPGDGSAPERLNHLYNRQKHAEGAIERGELLNDEGPLVVWLTNSGLRSVERELSYEELARMLDELANVASSAQYAGDAAQHLRERPDS
jgi:hypothetical protein